MSVECATQVEDMEVSLIEGMMVFSLIDRMDYSSSEEEDGFEDLFSLSIHRSEADSEEPSFGELFVKSGEEEKKVVHAVRRVQAARSHRRAGATARGSTEEERGGAGHQPMTSLPQWSGDAIDVQRFQTFFEPTWRFRRYGAPPPSPRA